VPARSRREYLIASVTFFSRFFKKPDSIRVPEERFAVLFARPGGPMLAIYHAGETMQPERGQDVKIRTVHRPPLNFSCTGQTLDGVSITADLNVNWLLVDPRRFFLLSVKPQELLIKMLMAGFISQVGRVNANEVRGRATHISYRIALSCVREADSLGIGIIAIHMTGVETRKPADKVRAGQTGADVINTIDDIIRKADDRTIEFLIRMAEAHRPSGKTDPNENPRK
jgi:hypothetical protein